MTLKPIEASKSPLEISQEHKEEIEVFLNTVPGCLSQNTSDSLNLLRQLAVNWQEDPLLSDFCERILNSISEKSFSPSLEASRVEILNKILS